VGVVVAEGVRVAVAVEVRVGKLVEVAYGVYVGVAAASDGEVGFTFGGLFTGLSNASTNSCAGNWEVAMPLRQPASVNPINNKVSI